MGGTVVPRWQRPTHGHSTPAGGSIHAGHSEEPVARPIHIQPATAAGTLSTDHTAVSQAAVGPLLICSATILFFPSFPASVPPRRTPFFFPRRPSPPKQPGNRATDERPNSFLRRSQKDSGPYEPPLTRSRTGNGDRTWTAFRLGCCCIFGALTSSIQPGGHPHLQHNHQGLCGLANFYQVRILITHSFSAILSLFVFPPRRPSFASGWSVVLIWETAGVGDAMRMPFDLPARRGQSQQTWTTPLPTLDTLALSFNHQMTFD